MSVQCKKPPFTNTMFIDRSKFQKQFWKGSLKEHFYEIVFKIWPIVSEKIFLWFCLCSYSQVAPIRQSHVYGQIKILQTIFEKGHPRNIPVELFQNLTSSFGEEDFLRISYVHIVQEAPFHQSHVYGRIKISRTVFEKGHPRNIPVKLFQNLTSSFGEEDFLRISSCPYGARSPHSPEPCL